MSLLTDLSPLILNSRFKTASLQAESATNMSVFCFAFGSGMPLNWYVVFNYPQISLLLFDLREAFKSEIPTYLFV